VTNWESRDVRVNFLKAINSEENKKRKAKSLQEYEIYNGNINQYVEAYLTQQLSAKTVSKMPIISSIEICKRVADQEASIYRSEPMRQFENAADKDVEAFDNVYADAMADIKLLKSNRYYKLQNQSMLQILPKDSKIDFRILFPHNFDVIPEDNDPEKAESVVISAFNKELYSLGGQSKNYSYGYDMTSGNHRDKENQISADQDDYKSQIERYVVWSKDYNFIMNGKGDILSEEISNPIGILPFVDIAADKDYNFFVDRGSQLSNFSVQYNAALSDLANIVRMQAYSQAVMIAPKEAMPEEITVGPTSIIKLAVDPNSEAQTDFKFVSPSPDLAGSIEFIEVLISNFLSSRGLSSGTVSGKPNSEKFTSGMDRFLSMIEKFEASKSDYALYSWVEQKAFAIIKEWLLYYSGSDVIDKKYYVSASAKDAELSVAFVKPEAVQSEAEKLTSIQTKMDLGLVDDVMAMMELHNIDETEAISRLDKMKARSKPQDEVEIGETAQLEANPE
jgi:hypothetical protein